MHNPDWSDMTCIDLHHLLGSIHLRNDPPKVTCKMGFENKAETTRIYILSLFGWYLKSIQYLAQVPSLKLTAGTWKWMVGRWVSFWVSAYFQGRTVSFVGCIQWSFLTHHPEVGTLGPDGGHLHISVANKERNLRRNQCKGLTNILYQLQWPWRIGIIMIIFL